MARTGDISPTRAELPPMTRVGGVFTDVQLNWAVFVSFCGPIECRELDQFECQSPMYCTAVQAPWQFGPLPIDCAQYCQRQLQLEKGGGQFVFTRISVYLWQDWSFG